MDVQTKITYRGMVCDALIANKGNPIDHRRDLLLNVSGLAKHFLTSLNVDQGKSYFVYGARYYQEVKKLLKTAKKHKKPNNLSYGTAK